MNDCANHLQVPKFFNTYIRQKTLKFIEAESLERKERDSASYELGIAEFV